MAEKYSIKLVVKRKLMSNFKRCRDQCGSSINVHTFKSCWDYLQQLKLVTRMKTKTVPLCVLLCPTQKVMRSLENTWIMFDGFNLLIIPTQSFCIIHLHSKLNLRITMLWLSLRHADKNMICQVFPFSSKLLQRKAGHWFRVWRRVCRVELRRRDSYLTDNSFGMKKAPELGYTGKLRYQRYIWNTLPKSPTFMLIRNRLD
jgi:hypothetical protein